MDRYEATGTPYPDPTTMCEGQCEGMGCYPVKMTDELTSYEAQEVARVIREGKMDLSDGYAFIKCEPCQGTGKRVESVSMP